MPQFHDNRLAVQLHQKGMGTLLAPKQVNSTRGTVEIHPYVQGRLRALPRQDETAGILLGTSDNGVTHVTGFKRVTPSALRQAASDAGPALAGFYRLQTANSPALLPEEEELWRSAQPGGHSRRRPGVAGETWFRRGVQRVASASRVSAKDTQESGRLDRKQTR